MARNNERAPDGCPDYGIPSCATCPLPICRYDAPPQVARSILRNMRIGELVKSGAVVDRIAATEGCSRRTVFRHKELIRTGRTWCGDTMGSGK